jgi:hypothetical protein
MPIRVEVKVCSSRSSHSAVLSISCIAREISMSTSTRDSSISSRLLPPRGSLGPEPRCSSSSAATCRRSDSTKAFS